MNIMLVLLRILHYGNQEKQDGDVYWDSPWGKVVLVGI